MSKEAELRKIILASVAAFAMPSISFADPPDGYYESAVGKTGAHLKRVIHTIVDGHNVLPYTDMNNKDWLDGKDIDVWEALVDTDSACPDDPGCKEVRLFYLGEARHINKANRGPGGDDTWERAHVWPTSRGEFKGKVGYTDLHHIRPADRNLNGAEGHWNYGYGHGSAPVPDKLADGRERDSGAHRNEDSPSFEPPDRAKGQVARMIFYMAVRYEGQVSKGMPDLEILVGNETPTKHPSLGDLCTLLSWNDMFGPTDFERRRNDRVHVLQGNRNPFIDKPEWANLIWGHRCQ